MANYGYLHLDLKAMGSHLHAGTVAGEEQLCLFDLLAASSALGGRTEAAKRGRTKEIHRAARCSSQTHRLCHREKGENKREKPTEAAGASV